MLQHQFHLEKATNRVTNDTTSNPYCYKNSRHNPLQFDQNQISTAQTVSNTRFAAYQISKNHNSGNWYQQCRYLQYRKQTFPNNFRTHITQLEFILAIEIERKNQTMEFSPTNATLNKQGTNFVCFTSSQPLIFRLLRKIHLQTTIQPFIPPCSTY